MDTFAHMQPTPEHQKIMRLARMDAEQLLSRAESLPSSRYKSLFVTNLENAMMWFNKATTHSPTDEPPLFEEIPDGDDPLSDSDPFHDK